MACCIRFWYESSNREDRVHGKVLGENRFREVAGEIGNEMISERQAAPTSSPAEDETEEQPGPAGGGPQVARVAA